jgi:hypothetical protein
MLNLSEVESMAEMVFDVTLRSPLGPKQGVLTLIDEGSSMAGSFALFGQVNPLTDYTPVQNGWRFSGSVATTAGAREYTATATLCGDELTGEMVFFLHTFRMKIPFPIPMKLTGRRRRADA